MPPVIANATGIIALLPGYTSGALRFREYIEAPPGLSSLSYGGYFNGGIGNLLLALFGLLGQTNLNATNSMEKVVSALLTAIAVAIYAWGVVAWPQALVMMTAATAGGYFGARLARLIPAPMLRIGIVVIGLIMTTRSFTSLSPRRGMLIH